MPAGWALRLGDARGPTSRPAAAAPALVRSSLVCVGSELSGAKGVDDVGTGGAVTAATAPDRLLAGVALSASAGSLDISTLTTAKTRPQARAAHRGAATSADLDAARAMAVTATGSMSAGVVATQSWAVTRDTLRGVVSSSCGEATADAWLLAGGGEPGRQERLLLANPGANPVSVDVELHGSKGRVASPNGNDVVVPARSRVNLLVDAISASEPTPAVHVSTSGGLVYAVLNDTWLDGTRPAGADDSSSVAPPSNRQVIPAVPVDGAARLRVVVPGDDEAVVQARALTTAGPKALPAGGVTRVAGGAVADIDLTGLPKGLYAVEVSADAPIVVAASVSRRTAPDQAGDFAWSPAARPVAELMGVATPARPAEVSQLTGLSGGSAETTRTLALAAAGDDVVAEVVVAGATGAATGTRITVPGDSVTSVQIPAEAASVWVRRLGAGELRAALVTQIAASPGPLVTVTALTEPRVSATAVSVSPLP
jgi:hypothetical protein